MMLSNVATEKPLASSKISYVPFPWILQRSLPECPAVNVRNDYHIVIVSLIFDLFLPHIGGLVYILIFYIIYSILLYILGCINTCVSIVYANIGHYFELPNNSVFQ